MSTPTSNQDPPFATEGLGDTVINLDEVCIQSILPSLKLEHAANLFVIL